jgi:hypothetical protein
VKLPGNLLRNEVSCALSHTSRIRNFSDKVQQSVSQALQGVLMHTKVQEPQVLGHFASGHLIDFVFLKDILGE